MVYNCLVFVCAISVYLCTERSSSPNGFYELSGIYTLTTFEVWGFVRSQLDALLHGHSYTAHAVGCASAVLSLQHFSDPVRNPNLLPDGRRLREVNTLMVTVLPNFYLSDSFVHKPCCSTFP